MPWESRPGCRSDVGLNRLGFTPCAHRLCAAQTHGRAHTSRGTGTNVLAPRQRSPAPSQRSMRAGIRLIVVAHVASRPPTSALTVQEHVMTLAHAHARLREEHVARTKPYGVCLERVSPRRRGNAHALSPWFSTPVDAYLCPPEDACTTDMRAWPVAHVVWSAVAPF